MPIVIRDFEEQDAKPAARLFFDSVRLGTPNFYSEEERIAWAPAIPDNAGWRNRLKSQITFIAESNCEIVGFVSFQENGYMDLLFVSPTLIGKGIGRALYIKVEAEAKELGLDELTTEASFAAKEFFRDFGWQVIQRQQIKRGTLSLVNFIMSKTLHHSR